MPSQGLFGALAETANNSIVYPYDWIHIYESVVIRPIVIT